MAVTLMEKGRHAGMWKVRVQPRDKNGARISVPTQYVEGTKKDAEKLERKLLVEAEEAVYDNYDAKKASLSESLERYIKNESELGRWEYATKKDWNYTLKLVKKYFGQTKLRDIDEKGIRWFARKYVADHGVTVSKDATVNRRLQHLRQFFKENSILPNPVPDRALAKFFRKGEFSVKKESYIFSDEEISRIKAEVMLEIDNMKSRPQFWGTKLMILVALCGTGMRPQEIQVLKWSQLIEENSHHVFKISDSWNEKNRHLNGHLKSRPSGESRLTLPLDEDVYRLLMEFHDLQKNILEEKEIIDQTDYIFLNLTDYRLAALGIPIGQQNTNIVLKRIVKLVGIDHDPKDISMYNCRHTVASKVAAIPQMNYPWAASRLGHTVDMFLKTYVHVDQDKNKEMLDLIGK